ncbi:MAG TPA: hypothetical protein VFL85_04150 [Candidatus Saccharimonadales bacterium]|nr:hypothetical protein [Candidatus Saccharimonadales bacterium]
MPRGFGRLVILCTAVLVTAGLPMAVASAEKPLASAHYKFEESDLGGGGLVSASSPHYQSVLSAGDTAVGHSASGNYQTEAGSQTTKDPALTVIIDNYGAGFGSFSPAAPAHATASFSVSNYTSYGYSVILMGEPPSFGGHTIAPMGADTGPEASQTGIDQFGINLVKNTGFCGAGCDVGADPDYGQFGAATAKPTANYNTPNKFRYVSGESIVTSPKSSGLVKYTISYIVNVGNLTPSGEYKSSQSIVVVGTF